MGFVPFFVSWWREQWKRKTRAFKQNRSTLSLCSTWPETHLYLLFMFLSSLSLCSAPYPIDCIHVWSMIMAVSMICVHTSLSLYLVHVWSVTNDHRCLCDLRSVFVGIAATSEPVSRVWLPVARLVCSTIALHLIWDNTCSGHGQVIWRLSHLHLETSHQ